ncbi:hypothetical protein ACGFYQ_42205 [Streptomyces sp. NPDC048258]|uniref:hypothetical protein n=1 Tax=Streptomyces sp. NPDC048258 TaxID=3365527 RepID=UPI00371B3E57
MAHQKASEGGGIVWCHDSGTACITFTDESKAMSLFARVDQSSPVYDAALDELSLDLSGLVEETQAGERGEQGKGSELKIGFLATGSGFLLVRKRVVGKTERLEDLVDIQSLTDLESMTSDQLAAYLRINLGVTEENAAGQWRRHYVSEAGREGGHASGVIHCRGAGKSCFVTLSATQGQAVVGNYFPTVGQDSPVYDPSLHELTVKLNSRLNEAQEQKTHRDPRAQIGLVITGRGLLPAWKVVDDGDYGDDADFVELDAMTDAQRDQFLRVQS